MFNVAWYCKNTYVRRRTHTDRQCVSELCIQLWSKKRNNFTSFHTSERTRLAEPLNIRTCIVQAEKNNNKLKCILLRIICRLSCFIHGQQCEYRRNEANVSVCAFVVNRLNRFNASNDPLVDWNNNNYVNIRILRIELHMCVEYTCIVRRNATAIDTANTSTLLPELIDFSFFCFFSE